MNLNVFLPRLMAEFCRKYNITGRTLPVGFNIATITDTVFLMIQNDRNLMHDYLQTIANQGNVGYVNSEIAKEIKRYFGLKNIGENKFPNSVLIQSFEEFQ
jgi:hypothetical protein